MRQAAVTLDADLLSALRLLLAKEIQNLISHKGNRHWKQTDLHQNPESVMYQYGQNHFIFSQAYII